MRPAKTQPAVVTRRRASPRPLQQLEVLGGEARWRASIASLRSGDLDEGERGVADAGPPSRGAVGRVDDLQHGLLDGDGHERAIVPVLGLGTEVERHPLRVGVVADDRHQLRGPGERVDPDQSRRPAAWPRCTQALPGPAITSTAATVSVPSARAKIA